MSGKKKFVLKKKEDNPFVATKPLEWYEAQYKKYTALKEASGLLVREYPKMMNTAREIVHKIECAKGESKQSSKVAPERRKLAADQLLLYAKQLRALHEERERLFKGPKEYPFGIPKHLSWEEKYTWLKEKNRKWATSFRKSYGLLQYAKDYYETLKAYGDSLKEATIETRATAVKEVDAILKEFSE
jgi:hypothetical protein